MVLEAEHFTGALWRGTHSWLTQADLAGSTGPGYLSALPDTDLRFETPYTSTISELQYTLNFTTTGTYYVWLRGYAPNAAGDSLYLALDDQPIVTLTGFAPGAWTWTNERITDSFNGTSAVATLTITGPGLHTLRLWQREDGLRLDRIILTTDSNYNPTNSGPTESERLGGSD